MYSLRQIIPLAKRFMVLLVLVALFLSFVQLIEGIGKLSNPEYSLVTHFLELLPINLMLAAVTTIFLFLYFRKGRLAISNAKKDVQQYVQNHLTFMGFKLEESGSQNFTLTSPYYLINIASGYGTISEDGGKLMVKAPRIYLKKLKKRIANSPNLDIKEVAWA